MKIPSTSRTSPLAYSLLEVLVAASLLGILFVALYSGMSAGFAAVQLARENLRATQVMQEKMETIRLYRWDQINRTGFIPTQFTEYFYTIDKEKSGVRYSGKVTISDAPITESYASELKMITIQLTWKSGKVDRSREMHTFVSRYGLQHYVY
jgi:type II secretory pathway pseudopilin PulG